MNVTATMNGQSVTVVSVVPNGHQIAITYVDASQNLKVDVQYLSGNGTIIGTGATVV